MFAKYLAVTGFVVVAGLIAADALLGPGGPGPSLVKDPPKTRSVRSAQTVALERPRDEVRPQQAAVTVAPSTTQSGTVMPAAPVESAPTPTFAALAGLPTAEEAVRAKRIAQAKMQAERTKRLARERARARAMARRLDPNSNGQLTPPDYAYAPRRTYGPFNQSQNGWGNQSQNGWGNGWRGQW